MDAVSFDKAVDKHKNTVEYLSKTKLVPVKLNINEDVQPIAQKKRHISFHILDQIDRVNN